MRVLVVGGGASGMACASLVKRRAPETEVTVLERGDHVSFSACGIPDWLGGKVEGGPDRLVVVDAGQARKDRGLDVRTQTTVQAIDTAEGRVHLEGGQQTLAYDKLVLATGVQPLDPFGARSAENAFAFRHLDDGIEAHAYLEAHDPEEACVVGGGFVGMELSEALIRRGVQTTLIQAADTLVGARLHPDIGDRVDEAVREVGVDLRTETKATEIRREDGQATAVELADGREVAADLVVVAVGTEPRSRLAEQIGCRTGEGGAVHVDEAMRTSVDDVLACGDCVAYPHRLTGERVRQPLALHANRSGRIAGRTLVDEEAGFPGVLGTAVTRFADTEIALTGLSEAEADRAGFDPVAATIDARTKAGYEPGAAPIRVRLVADRGTGRVVGGQIVGGPGAGKRIDTVASAIWMEATWEDLEAMDLAYAPPVSPAWDPVAIAARITGRQATS